MTGRKIFIGDVQGCLSELKELLDKLGFGDSDQCLFVGDLVNRGPDSLGVLRFIQQIGAFSVLGNHEAFLLKRGFFKEPGEPESWGTLKALARSPDRIQLGTMVESFPLLHEVSGLLLVHAALPPALWDADPRMVAKWRGKTYAPGTEEESETSFILSARFCDSGGRRPPRDEPPPGPPFRPWYEFYKGKPRVIFGHWARRGLIQKPKVLGLDTGCVYGGKLSAWIQEEDRIVQVSAKKAYWP